MAEIPELLRAPVVYAEPGMEQVSVRQNLVYRDSGLLMDVYSPPDQAPGERRPAG